VWEAEIFRTRFRPYDGQLLRQMTQRGEYFCIGTDAGRSVWIARGEGVFFLPSGSSQEGLSKHSHAVFEFLQNHGASFLSDIRENTPYSLAAINRSLSELFWRGVITNDAVDEVLNIKRYQKEGPHLAGGIQLPEERIEIVNPRRNPLKATAMRSVRTALKQVPGWSGRWTMVHTKSILGAAVTDQEKIVRQAQQLLLRYGVVAREIAKREENLFPWSMLAMEFQRMEMRGEIRRGYFVQGLSGMQFALPEAVQMLDETKSRQSKNDGPIVLNACDPANPYGPGIDHGIAPELNTRMSRIAGNYVILDQGTPIAWIENYGARLFFNSVNDAVLNGLAQFIHHLRIAYPNKNEIVLEYCNGQRPSESGIADRMRSLGFYRDKIQSMRVDLR
jgi:ATP-dependent Lhr-like helicase